MIKLLIDARTLGTHPSGIGIFIYDFLLELAKNSRFELHLLSDVAKSQELLYLHNELKLPLTLYGTQVSQSTQVFSYFGFVQKSMDTLNPDIFWEPNNIIPVRLKAANCKLVVTIHDIFPITQPKSHGTIYPLYFRYGIKRTLSQVDYIIYNSVETKTMTNSHFKKSRNIRDFVSYIIVPPVGSAKLPSTVTTPEGDTLSLDKEDYLLYLGNLEKRKGTDLLLKAYIHYITLGGRKKLFLGGRVREPEIQHILDAALAHCPEGQIRSFGYVNEEVRNALYANCQGFIFPSRAEGFGIPIIEAMHHHKPIVASNLSIFKEITDNCISFFDIQQPEEQALTALANAMLQLPQPDFLQYENIIAKYLPEALGQSFCNELAQLMLS